MKRLFVALVMLLIANAAQAQSVQMRHAWLDSVAGYYYHHPDFGAITAKLMLGRDTALAYRQLDTVIERHYGDMFWAMWTAATYYATQDVLRPDYKLKIRQAWKRFTPYRGDTENHFLLYYTGWFLMAQAFPDDPPQSWFNGKSSKQNYQEAREYLVQWVDETARSGQTEWDSPRYGYYYITPLILLSEYTQDAELKQLFAKALELQLADYALDYLDGNYVGAHSRVGDAEALDARHNEIAVYGNYFFGDSVANVLEDVAFAALSHFECPKIIRDIARDRSKPYESFEYKRGRTAIRNSSIENAPVYKYTYMTDAFALGSMQGGIVQPIQQQSWSLVIASDAPSNVITGHHPYVDSSELTMFFPEYPEFMMERIGAVKQGYPSEDKWVGGSPYERIYQDKNLLIARYNLPDSATYHHIDLHIPKAARFVAPDSVKIHSRPDDKWYWDRSTHAMVTYSEPAWQVYELDSVLIGIRMLSHYQVLDSGTRWRTFDRNSGYAIYVDHTRDVSIAAFRSKLSSLTKRVERPLTNHAADRTWLYRSPYVNSKLGSGIVTITHGADKLVLDFTK